MTQRVVALRMPRQFNGRACKDNLMAMADMLGNTPLVLTLQAGHPISNGHSYKLAGAPFYGN
jgi:hypothetical protein